ncbi:hypothetical protein [Mumia zhuanghuii]|jgi:hypothetical protein|uniref:Uncharacterized protein n=1 Tax=Mumia zhuanghuii TaxID=2585211 RepID=A0A5C4MKJ1_9ACTN|nr:hypothetical protein [Mumia zhuanghuii]TNC46239.1 hypothetical protein FHE65_13335 [Mumia zhuanghuii]TNC47333.1 hypothetical protein FHE65_09950 [Mumia zhuanghuii]
MRFTEHELTAAVTGVAKTVMATQDKDVRKGRRDIDEAWNSLSRYERYQLMSGLGDQVLPVLISLPDVEVEAGTRPTFTDEQIVAAVEERLGDERGIRRKALVKARTALVQVALSFVPPRADPDALTVPDHL